MPVSPAGQHGEALNALREALAASSAFQTWAGVASTAAARERIGWGVEVKVLDKTRPFIQLTLDSEGEKQRVASNTFVKRAGALVEIFGAVAQPNRSNNDNASLDAINSLGAFESALEGVEGAEVSGVRLEMRQIYRHTGIWWEDPETATGADIIENWRAVMRVLWGPEA